MTSLRYGSSFEAMKNALLITIAVLATGCATMVNGRFQTVSVDSFPSGARISVDCGKVPKDGGVTPAKVQVERAASRCLISFAREGYETREFALQHQRSRATHMNGVFAIPAAIIFGVVGAVVGSVVNGEDTGAQIGMDAGFDLGSDVATSVDEEGGGWKWVPGRLFVTLVRTELAAEPPDPSRGR